MKHYIKPEIEIMFFETEDAILDSGNGNRFFLPSPGDGGEDEIIIG